MEFVAANSEFYVAGRIERHLKKSISIDMMRVRFYFVLVSAGSVDFVLNLSFIVIIFFCFKRAAVSVCLQSLAVRLTRRRSYNAWKPNWIVTCEQVFFFE